MRLRRSVCSAVLFGMLALSRSGAVLLAQDNLGEGRPMGRHRPDGVWGFRDDGGPCREMSLEARRAAIHDPHANEPRGYRAFAIFDACTFAGRGEAPLGIWTNESGHGGRNIGLIQDPGAPASPPGVVVTRYPKGFVAGRGPVYWNGWDSAGMFDGQKREFYLSMWVKLDGEDFEAAPAVTKMGFIGYGQSPKVGVNQGVFCLLNGAKPRIARAFPIGFNQQNQVDRKLRQNVGRQRGMTAGAWHHWEAVFRLNSEGRADGQLQMWVDGEKFMDHRDVVYRKPGQPSGFTMFTWNPTWGGLNGTKTREDRILIDNIYLSGLDMEGRQQQSR